MDYLFKFCHSTLEWQPKMPTDGQPQRTEGYWESQSGLAISPRADVYVCDFIQLQNIYLSLNVNIDAGQQWVEINSPVPQRTHYVMFNRHILQHTHWGISLFTQFGQDQRTVLQLMCERWKEIKAISFKWSRILAAVGCGSLGQEERDWQ